MLNFEVLSEEGIAAGTRRIEALTGAKASCGRSEVQRTLDQVAQALDCATGDVVEALKSLSSTVRGLKKQLDGGAEFRAEPPPTSVGPATSYPQQRRLLRDAARLLNVSMDKLLPRVQALQQEYQRLRQELAELAASGELSIDALLEKAHSVGSVQYIVEETHGANPNLMRRWIEQLRDQSKNPIAVMLASQVGDDKVLLVAGLSKALLAGGASAAEWIAQVAPVVGGGGGGKPDFAQAGGKHPEKLNQALDKARQVISAMLSAS